MNSPRAISPRTSQGVIDWLLDGDPAIRWQVLRDLVGSPAGAVERERRNVARDGWGGRLLDRQGPDGRWAAGQTKGRRDEETGKMATDLPSCNNNAAFRRGATLPKILKAWGLMGVLPGRLASGAAVKVLQGG